MSDRTTINVAKFAHQEAKAVKEDDEGSDSWNDVLAFYAEYRPKVSNGGLGESESNDVDLTPVMNRIDDLETELTKQHEDMTGGR